jgi:DNA-binding NtrC family response regulator
MEHGTLDTVQLYVGQGEFAKALHCLNSISHDTRKSQEREFDTTLAELLLWTGDGGRAKPVAERLLKKSVPAPALLARLHLVIANAYFEGGRFQESYDAIQRALAAATLSADRALVAKTNLALLGLFSDLGATDNVVALITATKRSVARAADPQLMAALRIHFAKAEASRQSTKEARRHLIDADNLLLSYPNLSLQARQKLGLSVLDALDGQPDDAVCSAREAIKLARRSGERRIERAGFINLSHALAGIGDFVEAQAVVEDILLHVADDKEFHLAALDSKANLLLAQKDFVEAQRVIDEMDSMVAGTSPSFRSRWARSTIALTKARFHLLRSDAVSAKACLTEGIRRADECKETAWARRLRVAVLGPMIALGEQARAADLMESLEELMLPIETRIKIDAGVGRSSLGGFLSVARTSRARRAAKIIGNSALLEECSEPENDNLHLKSKEFAAAVDSAVALLELAAYPQILAREAFAVLQAANCVPAAALIARGEGTARVLETFGWDERQALLAARKGNPAGTIPCGSYRDDALEILAPPPDDLEQRCAFIAIKKLAATALTLDRYRRDEKQRAALWPAESLDSDTDCIWVAEPISEIISVARKIGPTPLTVLLTGETGTGKEMLARTIHRASERAAKIMLPFNCTAVPRDIFESQLFGYRRGAFTGADTSFVGVIRSSEGGTLFLDEIADVPLDVQPKLLRFLETHEVHPIGEPHPIKVDVRVIAATNANLEQLVAEGRFREDLFYRLNVVRLRMPPLRERREEIPALVEHYIQRYSDQQRKGRITLSDEALEYLLLYAWPGNIRQLANEVNRMVAMADADAALTSAHLSAEIHATRRTIAAAAAPESEMRVSLDQSLPEAVELLERLMVQAALDRSKGRVEEAAKLLGISRKGLFLKRRRWGLQQTS